MLAASISKLVVRTGTSRRLRIGAYLVFTVARLRRNKPHVPFASEFVFRGDLECFDFAVGDLTFVECHYARAFLLEIAHNDFCGDSFVSNRVWVFKMALVVNAARALFLGIPARERRGS